MKKLLGKIKGLFRASAGIHPGWSGDYSSWQEVSQLCTGYDAGKIFDKVKEAALKVKRGEAEFERDSVLFTAPEFVPEFIEILKNIADENKGVLNVLDFGGSLGSVYFQHRKVLNELHLQWNVVEQEHFVEFGKKKLSDEQLSFYYTVGECMKEQHVNLLLLSSVLSYIERPYDLIEEMISYEFGYILIDRNLFIQGDHDILTKQIVPPEIYEASYPCWIFNKENLVSAFKGYHVVKEFKPYGNTVVHVDDKIAYFDALLLKKNASKSR